MPTRNVNLTEELDRFVLEEAEIGRYENASEAKLAVLRASLNTRFAPGAKSRASVTSTISRRVASCSPNSHA